MVAQVRGARFTIREGCEYQPEDELDSNIAEEAGCDVAAAMGLGWPTSYRNALDREGCGILTRLPEGKGKRPREIKAAGPR